MAVLKLPVVSEFRALGPRATLPPVVQPRTVPARVVLAARAEITTFPVVGETVIAPLPVTELTIPPPPPPINRYACQPSPSGGFGSTGFPLMSMRWFVPLPRNMSSSARLKAS